VDRNYGKPQQPRSRIEIIADILRLLRLGSTGKTQITNYAKLNWDQGSKYVNNLIEAGFLEEAAEEMGLPCYRITKKGLKALSLVENLKEMFPPEGKLDIFHRSKILEINVGHILVTRGVSSLARENREFAIFVQNSLEQYRKGNWGEKSDEVNRLNTRSLEKNMRLFSAYEYKEFPEIWITTEPDRSYSTIMFPDELIGMEPLEDYRLEINLEPETAKDA
jgi:predicted transcriptional regulator